MSQDLYLLRSVADSGLERKQYNMGGSKRMNIR